MPSIVWDYFDEFEGGGKCRLCGCIRNRKDKSTSTFWQHLERVHGLDKRQMMLNGPNPLGSGSGSKSSSRNSLHHHNHQHQQQQHGHGPPGGLLDTFKGMIGESSSAVGTTDPGATLASEPDKMPKLELADSLGLDQRATEETFRFISELVRQQQQQQQKQHSHSAMPALEPATTAGGEMQMKREADLQIVSTAPIGINKRNNNNELVQFKLNDGEEEVVIFEKGGGGGGKRRKMTSSAADLPPTPPPSQASTAVGTPSQFFSNSSPLASSSSSLLLNNYLSGIMLEMGGASSPLNSFASLANSSPTPSFVSPIPQQHQHTNNNQMMPQQQNSQQTSTGQNDPGGILGRSSALQLPPTMVPLTNTTIASSNVPPKSPAKKRTDYLVWDEFFMGTAMLAAQRSKDPKTQVGACVVKDNIIIGIGYNGMPIGCHDDDMPWGKEDADPLNTKYLYVCHAEMNAILNKNCADITGATIYTTLFPCSECAKLIIQSRIKRVVYLRDKEAVQMEASRRLFTITGIKFSQFEPTRSEVVLRFK